MATEKPKRVLTPEQLDHLKMAREKAVAIRKKLQDERLTRDKESVEAPPPTPIAIVEPVKPKKAPKAKPEIIIEPSSESEDDEPIVIRKPKKTKSKKKRVVIVEDSSDDESDDGHSQVIFVKRNKAKQQPRETPPTPVAVPQVPKAVAVHEHEDPRYQMMFGRRPLPF